VLSRSFKQRLANALLAQWAGLHIGHTRPPARLPASVIFFGIFSHFLETQLLRLRVRVRTTLSKFMEPLETHACMTVSRNTALAPEIGLSGIRKDRVDVLRNYDVI